MEPSRLRRICGTSTAGSCVSARSSRSRWQPPAMHFLDPEDEIYRRIMAGKGIQGRG